MNASQVIELQERLMQRRVALDNAKDELQKLVEEGVEAGGAPDVIHPPVFVHPRDSSHSLRTMHHVSCFT